MNNIIAKENNLMKEIWKDIEDYEGLYQVSNMGRVKSLARTRKAYTPGKGDWVAPVKERILRASISKDGYYCVVLAKEGVNKHQRVNRLVAEAFIPNTENKPQVNHIDGNKLNNRVDNLEWVTAKENTIHSVKNGLQGPNPCRKAIAQYDLGGNFIRTWASTYEAGKTLHISCGSIKMSMKGIQGRTQASGYIWKEVTKSDL